MESAVFVESNTRVPALKCAFKRTIKGIPAAAKSSFAGSSIIPTIRKGKVDVVLILLTAKAEDDTPVLALPERAEVPKLAFLKVLPTAVALSVKVASEATLKS